jgi:uncharacterized protein (DUF1501 family)
MILNRRKFIKGALGTMAVSALGGGLIPRFSFAAAGGGQIKNVIWINQQGGCDTKSLFPYLGGSMKQLMQSYRPNINPATGLNMTGLLQSNPESPRGFHNSLSELVTYCQTNNIGCAVVGESGITTGHSFSHEEAQNIMMNASPKSQSQLSGGWFGRLVQACELQSIQAWSIGFQDDFFLNSNGNSPMILSNLNQYTFRDRNFGFFDCTAGTCEGGSLAGDGRIDANDDSALARNIAKQLNSQTDDLPFDEALRGVVKGNFDTVGVVGQISSVIAEDQLPLFRPATDQGLNDGLQRSLFEISRIITFAASNSAPPELKNSSLFFATSIGGWDTHTDQATTYGLPRRALVLAAAIKGLLEMLRRANQLSNTVIVMQSEFGRTVRENGGRGTDHGHGSDFFVCGGPIKRAILGPVAEVRGNTFAAQVSHTSTLKAVLSRAGISSDQLAQIFPDVYPGETNLDLFK